MPASRQVAEETAEHEAVQETPSAEELTADELSTLKEEIKANRQAGRPRKNRGDTQLEVTYIR